MRFHRYQYRAAKLFWCAAILILGGGIPQASAQTPASLKLVPADVAFYSASMRLREQYDIFVASKAFAKLQQLPVVQMGWAMFQSQWNDPEGEAAPFRVMLEQPENQELVNLLVDGMSSETFFYGDDRYGELLEFFNEINEANRAAQLSALSNSGDDVGEQVAERLLRLVSKRLDTFTVPDTVFGFRLDDPARAIQQIDRLEQLARFLLAQQPGFAERVSRKRIAGFEYLTLNLDGSLVPLDQLPLDGGSEVEDLREKVRKLTLAISIGVRDEFLLISIGDTSEHLAELGKGQTLDARKEIMALDGYAQRRVSSVAYVSESLMTQANTVGRQVDQLVQMAESLVPLAPIDPALQVEIIDDAEALATEIKESVLRSGAVSGIGFMTAGGFEHVRYNWGENRGLDSSKPLSILKQLGRNPLLAVAGRRTYSPQTFDQFVKWSQRLFYYFEQIGIEQLDPEAQEFFQKTRADILQLLDEAGQVTREKLLPALKDGQVAFVFDAKTSSKQWHAALPASADALPGPELGIVYGVSDPALLREAAAEYLRIAQRIVDVLHQAEPDRVPKVQLVAPESRQTESGMIYYYKFPQTFGLDRQVAPNAGLSEDTLVLSLVPKMTLRLLNPTDLVATGPLADSGRSVGAVSSFDFAGLLEALIPWIDYGMMVSGEEVAPNIRQQIRTGIEIAQCFRGISRVSYKTGEAVVSHYEIRFEDVP